MAPKVTDKPVAITNYSSNPVKTQNSSKSADANPGKPATKDEFNLTKVAKPSGLVKASYTIEDVSSLDIIAGKLGIPTNDLIAQLKDQKLLAANYNINGNNKSDPSFIKKGKTITVSVPKNKDDIDKDSPSPYRQWMKYERAHYQKCIETGKNVLASTNTEASECSFYSMA